MADPGSGGIAELLAALEAEAEEELARADESARQEAADALAAARVDADRLERRPAEEQRAELEREVARRLSAARLDAARTLRAAREAAFAEALGALRGRLQRLREGDRYGPVLEALLVEAWAALPGARRLRLDPRDVSLAPATGLEVDAVLHTLGGVELADDAGRVVVNTLEERLANGEPELRRVLARVAAEALQ